MLRKRTIARFLTAILTIMSVTVWGALPRGLCLKELVQQDGCCASATACSCKGCGCCAPVAPEDGTSISKVSVDHGACFSGTHTSYVAPKDYVPGLDLFLVALVDFAHLTSTPLAQLVEPDLVAHYSSNLLQSNCVLRI